MVSPKQNVPAENIGNAPQDTEKGTAHGDVLAIYEQDQPERSLEPHEF